MFSDAKADTTCMADFAVGLQFDLRILLPSTATTSPSVNLEIDAVQLEKQHENSLWSKRANNVPKTSCDGLPFSNGKYLRNQGNLTSPNSLMDTQLSAPLITVEMVKNSISCNG